jgi:hypothetical protein
MILESTKFIAGVILFLGLLLRIYFQIVGWPYSGDEINLGLDILNHSYQDLFKPFHSRQSAPPLFLLLEKIISGITKPYISLKILSLLSSCASIFLFNRILKKSFRPVIYLILLAIFCFNPFILVNSLTLKQYTLDLTMGLIAVNYFYYQKSFYITFLFYCIFCLISNVGLFFCAALTIFHLFKIKNRELIKTSILRLLPYILAPIPYLVFFLWFINQSGALRMQHYMVNYWDGAFMPLDHFVFHWFAIQGKVIYFFFFSTYVVIGVLMLLVFLVGISFIIKNRHNAFSNERSGVAILFILVIIFHLMLSALKMYPFSDRLFLYMAPGVYLILGLGLEKLTSNFLIDSWRKNVFPIFIIILPLFAIISYFTYLPNKKNDVVALKNFLEDTDKAIYFTPQAKQLTLNWLNFTKYFKEEELKFLEFEEWNSNNKNTGLLVTTQNKKFGHSSKYTKPNPQILKLLANNKIVLYKRVSGFAIYKFKI